MQNEIKYHNLGLLKYSEVWAIQKTIFDNKVKAKGQKIVPTIENDLLLCEHHHVYTLGKSGEQNNLLINDEFLKSISAEYFKIDRGGDITYHGPGQIVGYPILDLEQFNMLAKKYIYNLEQVIINVLKEYGINSERLEGATGVWLDTNAPSKTRKICAIGVKVSRWVSMHGFAFNVNTDLNYFNYINPCGFTEKGVTSLNKELGETIDIKDVTVKLLHHFSIIFNSKLIGQ
jgi:lipoyl(octanoyl) transferase